MAPRKRKAQEEPEDEADDNQDAPAAAGDEPEAAAPTNMREQQRQIARRRAAHFAHFGEAAEEEDNVHVGANNARTLGPWSSAVELVNARQAAIDERNSKLQQQAKQQEEDVPWEPARDPALGPRPAAAVPSLFSLAVTLLVRHISAVTSLWGVPDSIRSQLAAAVCAQRKLSPEVALLFGQDTPTELVIPDCSQLDAKSMAGLLRLLLRGSVGRDSEDGSASPCPTPPPPPPPSSAAAGVASAGADLSPAAGAAAAAAAGAARLERLELGSCGRGFDDKAAAVVASAGPLTGLRVLRLGGAYRLGDAGLLKLLEASPGLQELAVPSAPRLTGAFLSQLPRLAPGLTSLDLSGCGGLSGQDLSNLLAQMQQLERLALDGIDEVDAQVLAAASRAAGLRSLSLSFCRGVDDAALAALAAAGGSSGSNGGSNGGSSGSNGTNLQELVLDDCTGVSDAGLLALLDGRDGCRSLQRLSVAHCCKLTDASLVPLAERGVLESLNLNSLHKVGPATLQALARSCGETLQELNVSFCRGITEGSVGALVDRCSKLGRLSVYSCTQLTQRFLHGHSRDELVVLGVPTSCL